MKTRNIILIISGIIIGLVYIIIANSVKTTELIWILTRSYGLIAYFFLGLLVINGELKLLGFTKFFKFHCPLGIITFYFALLHGISAVFEKFKWGQSLSFSDYLGFNFSDKWLFFMSLGTLAFYLIIIISMTSSTNTIQRLGFKKWKLVHFLSYLVLFFVFFHSLILGTDIKTSSIRNIVFPVFLAIFFISTGTLGLRLLRNRFIEKLDTSIAIILIIFLSIALSFSIGYIRSNGEQINTLKTEKQNLQNEIYTLQTQNQQLSNYANIIKNQIELVKANSDRLSKLLVVPTQTTQPIIQTPEPIIPEQTYETEEYEPEEEDD